MKIRSTDLSGECCYDQKQYLKFYTCISLCGANPGAQCRTLLKLFYQLDVVGRLLFEVAAQVRVALEDRGDPKQLLSHPG